MSLMVKNQHSSAALLVMCAPESPAIDLAIQSMRSYSYEEWEGREDEPAVVTPLSEKLVSCGKQRHDCKRPWMVCSVLDNLKRFVPASRQVSYVSTTTRLHAKHSS